MSAPAALSRRCAAHPPSRCRPRAGPRPPGDPRGRPRRVRAVRGSRSATCCTGATSPTCWTSIATPATGSCMVAEVDGVVRGSGAFYPDASIQGLGWPSGWAGGRALAVHPQAASPRRRAGPARRLRAAGPRARCTGVRLPHREPHDRGGRAVRAPRLLPSARLRPGPRAHFAVDGRTAPSVPTRLLTASSPAGGHDPLPHDSRPNTPDPDQGSLHDQSAQSPPRPRRRRLDTALSYAAGRTDLRAAGGDDR